MYFRRLVLLGIGAALAVSTPAIASSSSNFVRLDKGRTASIELMPKMHAPKRKTHGKAKKNAKAEPMQSPGGPLENNGQLRSEQQIQPNIFSVLFGGDKQQLLPETRDLDAALREREERRPFKVKAEFQPQSVPYSGYDRGTIIIDTSKKFLYLMRSSNSARRYPIAVGREGLQFKGTAMIGDKQEWPR